MASYQNQFAPGIPFAGSDNICNSSHHVGRFDSNKISFSGNGHLTRHDSTENSKVLSNSHHTQLPYQLSLLPGPRISTFTELQDAITNVLQSNLKSPLARLHSLLNAYSSNPAHWSMFAHGDSSKKYTRNLVYEVPGIFNFLLLVWTPGKASQIHDHADSHCLMKVLQGDLRERRYATPKESSKERPLNKVSDQKFGLNQVTYISDQLGLHDISNPSNSEYAVSLHLYFPPNAALKGCHVYDIKNGRARHVMQDKYDSISGEIK